MARRRSASDDVAGTVFMLILGAVASLVMAIISIASRPEFWVVAGLLFFFFCAYKAWNFYWDSIWPNKYFSSEEFLIQKTKIEDYVAECNELNDHIADLRCFQDEIKSANRGSGTLLDMSEFNFQRKSWRNKLQGENVYNCSRSIVNSAQNSPFKYLCKYFRIKADEQTLADFETMLNDFSAAADGVQLLIDQRESLITSIIDNIHPRIKRKHFERLQNELGFEEVIFDQLSYPIYSFQYVSAGGNSSLHFDIELDVDTTEDFVQYLGELVSFRKSVAGQRALMTKSLRDSIKERDDHTCQACGISAYTTKNLLLEIDHIMPLAKGGITTESNLQTLCWKCNRAKGSKI